jgi:hypothetical protein
MKTGFGNDRGMLLHTEGLVEKKILALLYAFKALHGLAPSYLGELIHFYKPARSLRSQSAALIEMPKNVRTKIYG